MTDTIKATVLESTLPQPEPGVYYLVAYRIKSEKNWYFISGYRTQVAAQAGVYHQTLGSKLHETRIIRVELPV